MPNLLLQKFPAPQFTATAKLAFHAMANEDQAGLIVMGTDYAYASVKKKADGLYISQTVCQSADQGKPEREIAPAAVTGDTFYLRVAVSQDAMCRFSFSTDGASFREIGEPFAARPGRWIGAKVGLFALGSAPVYEYGWADFDWFRVSN